MSTVHHGSRQLESYVLYWNAPGFVEGFIRSTIAALQGVNWPQDTHLHSSRQIATCKPFNNVSESHFCCESICIDDVSILYKLMHFISQYSKELNNDWNKAMNSVSNGALEQVTKDSERNTFLPNDNDLVLDGLQILFFSTHWTSALHYLGIKPGNVFPHQSNLKYVVERNSNTYIRAKALEFMNPSHMLSNIPIGSMFRTDDIFLWAQYRASMKHSISNRIAKKNTGHQGPSSSQKSRRRKQSSRKKKKSSNLQSHMDVNDTHQESQRQDENMEKDLDQCSGSEEEQNDGRQNFDDGKGAGPSRTDGNQNATAKGINASSRHPRSKSFISDSGSDEDTSHNDSQSVTNLMLQPNFIPIFKALESASDSFKIGHYESSSTSDAECSLEPKSMLGLANLCAALMSDSSIRNAVHNTEFVSRASQVVSDLAKSYMQSQSREKNIEVQKSTREMRNEDEMEQDTGSES